MSYNFIDKLDYLLKTKNLNKSTLSKESGIPYTTIDGWYKKGYEGLKLTTLRKLSKYLNVDIGYWIDMETLEPNTPNIKFMHPDLEYESLYHKYSKLDDHGKDAVNCILELELSRIEAEIAKQAKAETLKKGIAQSKIVEMEATEELVDIPYFHLPASAGFGNYLSEGNDHKLVSIPQNEIPMKANFIIEIQGDSMEPTYRDGTALFIRETLEICSGKIGIFILNNEAYCKQLYVDHENRQIRLRSHNANYSDIVIGENDDFRTVGEVLGVCDWSQELY